ncbi:RidA family protein [Pseudomonas typographi]|uniref:RidA family protein n=1 Tax=Pseudomonas typographi TaxID=2715964 RepID=A0ABR7YVB8_9PSED|nr:RidA family protein [Pseudomonas typographi]MBD1552134.1 RidA family protein [Pseudomonas typographi]MBD1585106.1 RidA family protein [Pseudomonas typographi]MBD1597153.1 RidA family protein [Pseudomonas typographi]
MLEVIDTGIARSAAPLNGTVRAGHQIFTAHISKDPSSGMFVDGDIEQQTRQALSNLRQAMQAAGGSLANVVQVQVFLVERSDAAAMNKVYAEFFDEPYPCRATVVVKELLSAGARIELIAQAVCEPQRVSR